MSTIEIATPPKHPTYDNGLIDVGVTGDKAIHNGKPAFGSVLSPIERSCQYLAARRKMDCSGTCTPYELSSTGSTVTATWYFDCVFYSYIEEASVYITYSTDQDNDPVSGYFTATGTGSGAIYHLNDSTGDYSIDYLNRASIEVEVGDGDSGIEGVVNIEVELTLTDTCTVTVWSISIHPEPMTAPIDVEL